MNKAPLKPKFLSRKSYEVSLLDLLTLLYHVREGAMTPEVGFLDANNTIEALTKKLNRKTWVSQEALESALWSCNLMDEVDKFHDYSGRNFEQFLKSLLGSETYDRFFCLIEDSTK